MRRSGSSSGDLAGMEMALRLARAAAVHDEVPVGAALIHEGELLAEGHNETVRRGDPTAHAELLVLQRAIGAGHAERVLDATLYVTLEPCAQCAGAIVLARVRRVVFGAFDGRAGMAGSVHDLLRHPKLNHRPEVIGGVRAEECGDLLKGFFRAKRD